jgi:hypothetical protein
VSKGGGNLIRSYIPECQEINNNERRRMLKNLLWFTAGDSPFL